MNSSGYGPPSAQRLPPQQTYEAPACVQNAMMNKDRKPFTYTPGGIDLSQIKSERMAKRLARNAQSEGATGTSQMNRPAQPPCSPGGTPIAATIGAAAMGVPFQVFPASPPTPPTPPAPTSTSVGKQQKPNGSIGGVTAPPPPPPPSSNNTTTTHAPHTNKAYALAATGSPNAARKSPTPQKFEPPPMGFRPEIKIPPNPMAALKKITPPVEKNNFWVEEYRKERSKSPMVDSSDNNTQYNSNGTHDNTNDDIKNSPVATSVQQPGIEFKNNYNINNNNNNNNNYQRTSTPQQQQQQVQQPFSPIMQQPQPQSPKPEFRSVTPPQSPTGLVYTQQQRQPQQNNNAIMQNSPIQQQQQQVHPVHPSSPFAQQLTQQPKPSPTAGYSTSSPSQITPPSNGPSPSPAQSVPWRVQRSPQQQEQLQSKMQQPQQPQPHSQPIYNNVKPREVRTPTNSETTAVQQQPLQQPYQGPKPTNVGSLYIAPLEQPNEAKTNVQRQPPTARWLCSQPVQKEQPAWARPEENGNVVPSTLQCVKSPPAPNAQPQPQPQQQYRSPQGDGYAAPTAATGAQNFGAHPASSAIGLRLQINAGTNNNQSNPKERIIPIQLEETPTPTHTPGQPSFGTQVQYNNVNQQMAGAGNIASSGYVMRSPNQFVDQGYNNYNTSSQQQQQPQQQQQKTTNNQYNNSNAANVGGPKTHIIPIKIEDQNEGTRGPISQIPIVLQNDQRTPPVQSKSFRILQKITDTIGDQNGVTASGAAPVSAPAESTDDAESQLQKPQFSRQMSAQQARKSPNIEQMKRMQISQEQQQAWNQGSPAVKQASMQPPNKQRTIYTEDTSKQYIHPSEQQVPEPKKYTGSAIPSRSFKILQAMTTPENAGPGQSDL